MYLIVNIFCTQFILESVPSRVYDRSINFERIYVFPFRRELYSYIEKIPRSIILGTMFSDFDFSIQRRHCLTYEWIARKVVQKVCVMWLTPLYSEWRYRRQRESMIKELIEFRRLLRKNLKNTFRVYFFLNLPPISAIGANVFNVVNTLTVWFSSVCCLLSES